jgi:hypothetical protein
MSAEAGSRVSLLREDGGALSRDAAGALALSVGMAIGLATMRGGGGAFMLKLLALPLKSPSWKAFPWVCFMNAAYSGFWSCGMTLGEAAAVEWISDEGETQFWRACGAASLMKPPESCACNPK